LATTAGTSNTQRGRNSKKPAAAAPSDDNDKETDKKSILKHRTARIQKRSCVDSDEEETGDAEVDDSPSKKFKRETSEDEA
jgi:hypothetical protein